MSLRFVRRLEPGGRTLPPLYLGESVTLGVLGGVLGLIFAYGCLRLLAIIGPADLPCLDEIRLDFTALVFTVIVSLLAGVLFGLIPVWNIANIRPGSGLRDSSRSVSAGRNGCIRIICSRYLGGARLVLLICSGLMIRGFY